MKRLKDIIKKWLETKALDIESKPDENRHKRDHIIPGPFDGETYANDEEITYASL
jgi:hypothetical protein